MKKSRYSYFFDCSGSFVGYSWLADDYVSFPLDEKKIVEKILKNPDAVLTNKDSRVFRKLMETRVLIPEKVEEFNYIWQQHLEATRRNDELRLIILPTLSCNLNCPYCYETHAGGRITTGVVSNIKSYLEEKIGGLKKLRISWFGGEPLLCPDVIQDIGKFASELTSETGTNFSSDITTNATLLDEDRIKKLDRAGVRKAHITLDGPKTRHDRTRISEGGGKTYEKIISNAKKFLEFNPENKLVLRVHVHSKEESEIQGIGKALDRFEDCKFELKVYFRQLFSSCSEKWSHDQAAGEKLAQSSRQNRKIRAEAIKELYNEALDRGFNLNFSRKSLTACYAARSSAWVIKPDGLLHKCTVALEKERSLGRLAGEGIKYFWDRYTTWKKRASPNFSREGMRNCSVFPLSWGKCPYSSFQNPSEKLTCEEINNSLRTKEKLMALKSRYKREVRDQT